MMMKTEIVLVCFVLLAKQTAALQCYICSATENDADTTCADDVTALGSNAILDCNKKFCTIVRIDYVDPKGKLSSISRNCVDKVPADGITEDSTFRTYLRSCKTDLCNSGSGKTDSSSSMQILGDKATIYAPGTGYSRGEIVTSSLLILMMSCFFVMGF